MSDDLQLKAVANDAFVLVDQVKQNLHDLKKEWTEFRAEHQECLDKLAQYPEVSDDYVTVRRKDLSLLRSEVMRLKQYLPTILNQRNLQSICKLPLVEKELDQIGKKASETQVEASHWKSQCELARMSCEAEREEKFAVRCEVQNLTNQLSQQSDYCAAMGAACCTLLWRVSRCEESIQSILVGTKVDEFLQMVASTIQSYVATYKDDVPQESAEETQFVLALCGTFTNIAASVYGREFLVTNVNGRALLDTFVMVLSEAPNNDCAKMKNLVLMALYNISINQKGLQYLSKKSGFLGLLVWLLQEEKKSENRLHTLRLIQSILYEPNNPKLLMEFHEVFPVELLRTLSRDTCREIQEAALELMTDLKTLDQEMSSSGACGDI